MWNTNLAAVFFHRQIALVHLMGGFVGSFSGSNYHSPNGDAPVARQQNRPVSPFILAYCIEHAFRAHMEALFSEREVGVACLRAQSIEPGILCILYYTILYYTILYYTILYYTILYYTIPYHTILEDLEEPRGRALSLVYLKGVDHRTVHLRPTQQPPAWVAAELEARRGGAAALGDERGLPLRTLVLYRGRCIITLGYMDIP